jgi:hypothetical protein
MLCKKRAENPLTGPRHDAVRELLCTTNIGQSPGGPLRTGKVKVPAPAREKKYSPFS